MKTLNTTEKKSIETPEKWQIWRKRINREKTPEKTPELRKQSESEVCVTTEQDRRQPTLMKMTLKPPNITDNPKQKRKYTKKNVEEKKPSRKITSMLKPLKTTSSGDDQKTVSNSKERNESSEFDTNARKPEKLESQVLSDSTLSNTSLNFQQPDLAEKVINPNNLIPNQQLSGEHRRPND